MSRFAPLEPIASPQTEAGWKRKAAERINDLMAKMEAAEKRIAALENPTP